MRTETHEVKIFTFKEANKELRDKIRSVTFDNSEHYDHVLEERINTLVEVANLLDATLDYSLSVVPDRGEYIRFTPNFNDESLNYSKLWEAIDIEKECPLTGAWYDHDFIDYITKYNIEDNIEQACRNYIESIHEEYQSMLKDDYLLDLCEANGYEFGEDGKIY